MLPATLENEDRLYLEQWQIELFFISKLLFEKIRVDQLQTDGCSGSHLGLFLFVTIKTQIEH